MLLIGRVNMAKILLVEDEASLLELLSEVVTELGHTVFRATNGQEALVRMKQEHLDLVISDVMMPFMDGYVLLEQINLNPQWNKIKTILVSAVPINRTHLPPPDAYASKPYDLDLIESLIEHLAAD